MGDHDAMTNELRTQTLGRLKQVLAELQDERQIYPRTPDGDALRTGTVAVMLESIIESLTSDEGCAKEKV
jgi:hypothetical protein